MDLTLIPLEDLVGAIQRLEVAHFRWGEMTVEQLTTTLTLAKERRLEIVSLAMIVYREINLSTILHLFSVSFNLFSNRRKSK